MRGAHGFPLPQPGDPAESRRCQLRKEHPVYDGWQLRLCRTFSAPIRIAIYQGLRAPPIGFALHPWLSYRRSFGTSLSLDSKESEGDCYYLWVSRNTSSSDRGGPEDFSRCRANADMSTPAELPGRGPRRKSALPGKAPSSGIKV
jgi:hypothetical protein